MKRIGWIMAASVVVPIIAAQDQGPQFRAGTQRIVVDVIVTDRKSKSVRDLACEHFALKDNGAPQKLATCEFHSKTAAGLPKGENNLASAPASQFRPLADRDR